MWNIIGKARQLFSSAALENTRTFIRNNRLPIGMTMGAVAGLFMPVLAAIDARHSANDVQSKNDQLNAALAAKQVEVTTREDVIRSLVDQVTKFQKDLSAAQRDRNEIRNNLDAANETIAGDENQITTLQSALATTIAPSVPNCDSIKGDGYTIACAPNDLYARADRIVVARGIMNTFFTNYSSLRYTSKGNPSDAARMEITQTAMQSLASGQFHVHILRREDTITLEHSEKETAILIDGRNVYVQPYTFAHGDDSDYADFINNMRDGIVGEPKGGPYIAGDIVGSMIEIFGNPDLMQSMGSVGVIAFGVGDRLKPRPPVIYDSNALTPGVRPPDAAREWVPPAPGR